VQSGWTYTANNFELMYSRQRISQNSFPKFLYIVPKSFIIFLRELLDAAVSLGSSEWNYCNIFQPIIGKYSVSFLEISNPLFRRILFPNSNYKNTCRIIFLFFELHLSNLEMSYC
jgi:hypothetical protein